MALVLGSALALAGGALVGSACSSSSSGSGSGSGGGSGSGSGSSSGGSDASTDSAMGTDSSNETDSGTSSGGADCGTIPSQHQNPAGTIYCGYGADGGEIDCTLGNLCCLGGELGGVYSPQVCSAWNAAGTGCMNPAADSGATYPPIGIACNQISDCTANGSTAASLACCLQGAMVSDVPGCGYPKAKDGNDIICETTTGGTANDAGVMVGTCATGETQICSSQTDCPSGTTCTYGKWKIYDLGFCQ